MNQMSAHNFAAHCNICDGGYCAYTPGHVIGAVAENE